MAYWLLIYLFAESGEFQAKDIYETASKEQCEKLAEEYTRTIINTHLTAQFNCVSDQEYKNMIGDEE